MRYEYFWRRVADYVPTRRRLKDLERVVAQLEQDHDEELLDLRARVDALERAVDHLRLELKRQSP